MLIGNSENKFSRQVTTIPSLFMASVWFVLQARCVKTNPDSGIYYLIMSIWPISRAAVSQFGILFSHQTGVYPRKQFGFVCFIESVGFLCSLRAHMDSSDKSKGNPFRIFFSLRVVLPFVPFCSPQVDAQVIPFCLTDTSLFLPLYLKLVM